MNYFITGIGTNVGKTFVAAVLTEALKADYWKPVQSGTIEGLDSDTVRSLISNPETKIHPEAYLLKEPLSPHFAARIEGVEIVLEKVVLPRTDNSLIIEGAGGLLVPLNRRHMVIDLARHLAAHVVLVVSDYLGCINHALLSMHYLQAEGYKIDTLVLNGNFEDEVRNAILEKAPACRVISLPRVEGLGKEAVSGLSGSIRPLF